MKRVINKFSISVFLLILVAVIIVVVVVLNRPDNQQQTSSKATSSANNPAKTSSSNNINKTSPSAPSSNKLTTPPSNGTLVAPSGTFVSNHHPSLSQTSPASLENSICNTSPGAQCTITFTKDGATKSLAAKVADGYGNATWNWRPGEVGLTAGSWQINAVATLDGQSKNVTDPLALEVSP